MGCSGDVKNTMTRSILAVTTNDGIKFLSAASLVGAAKLLSMESVTSFAQDASPASTYRHAKMPPSMRGSPREDSRCIIWEV